MSQSPLELIDRAMFLASGQDDAHSVTIAELCDHLEFAVRAYAAACDALDYAHAEGFQWPVDPHGSLALTFCDIAAADSRLASAIEARSDETRSGSAEDESAAPNGGDAHA